MAIIKPELVGQCPVTDIWSAQPGGAVAGAEDLRASNISALSVEGSMSRISTRLGFPNTMTFFGVPLNRERQASLEGRHFVVRDQIVTEFNYEFPLPRFLKIPKTLPSSFFLNFSFMVLTISAYVHFGEGFIRIAGGLRQKVHARPGPTVLLLGASVQRGFGSEGLPLEPNLGKP